MLPAPNHELLIALSEAVIIYWYDPGLTSLWPVERWVGHLLLAACSLRIGIRYLLVRNRPPTFGVADGPAGYEFHTSSSGTFGWGCWRWAVHGFAPVARAAFGSGWGPSYVSPMPAAPRIERAVPQVRFTSPLEWSASRWRWSFFGFAEGSGRWLPSTWGSFWRLAPSVGV